MAIAARATAQANTLTATTSTTVTIPSSVVADDVLLLLTANRNSTTDPSVTDNDTGGNTWARITGQDNTGSGDLWWKRATSGSASKTVTVSGATTSVSAVLAAFSGCQSTGTPYEAASAEANASANETHAAITTLGSGRMVVFGVVNLGNDNTVTSPAATNPAALTTTVIESLNDPTGTTNECATCLNAAAQTGSGGTTGAFTWAQTNGITVSIAVALIPDTGFSAVLSESVRLDDSGVIEFVQPGWIKVTDTVTADIEVAGGGDLSAPPLSEAVRVSESEDAALLLLVTTLTESVRVADGPASASFGLGVGVSEAIRVSDALTAVLSPLRASVSEAVRVSDTVTPLRVLALLTVALSESLDVTDATNSWAELTVPEYVRASDTVLAERIDPAEPSVLPIEVPAEGVRVSELVVATLSPVLVSVTETLRVTETATALVTPLLATATESVRVTDAVTASLSELTTALGGESVRVTESVTAVLSPLAAAALVEGLQVAESAAATLTPEQTSLTENVRVSDAVTASLGELTITLTTESVRVTESVTAVLSPLATAATESLQVAESAAATLTPEQTSLTENVRVTDAVTASLGELTTALGESVRVTESVVAVLSPLTAAALEDSVRVTDLVAARLDSLAVVLVEDVRVRDEAPLLAARIEAGTLVAAPQEGVRVAEAVSVLLTPLAATLLESVRVAESVTAARDLAVALTELLDVTDVLLPLTATEYAALTASPTDAVKVSDTPSTLLTPLVVTLSEGVRVTDGPASGSFGLAVSRQETVRVSDSVLVALTPVLVAVSESVKVSDAAAAQPVSQETLVATPTEDVRVTDTVSARLTLLQIALSDAVRVTESVTAVRELVAVVGEALTVTDGVVTAQLDRLYALAQEAIKVRDLVSAATTLLQVSVGEAVRVSDAVSAASGLLVTLDTDAVRVSDSVAAKLHSLSVVLVEPVQVSDVLTPPFRLDQGTLNVTLGESVKVSDLAPGSALTLLRIPLTEGLRVSEQFIVFIGVGAILADTVRVRDEVQATLTPLEVRRTERVRVDDGGLVVPIYPVWTQIGSIVVERTCAVRVRVADSWSRLVGVRIG